MVTSRFPNMPSFRDDPAFRAFEALENSPAVQIQRQRSVTGAQFEKWVEEQSVQQILRHLEQSAASRALQQAGEAAAAWTEATESHLQLAQGAVESISTELLKIVQPYTDELASLAAWHDSLAARMAALEPHWILHEQPALSFYGFARLARLSDAVHAEKPFSQPVREFVAEELGTDHGTRGEGDSPTERDEDAIAHGLNSELIAFPEATYKDVVEVAGFRFQLTRAPLPQAERRGVAIRTSMDIGNNAVIFYLEQHVRHLVEQSLGGLSGSKWMKQRVSKAVLDRWKECQADDRDRGRAVFPLLQYADFMDLKEIICRQDNWRDVFGAIFINKAELEVSFQRLHPIRNSLAHSRPLARCDTLVLVCEATQIFNAMGVRVLDE